MAQHVARNESLLVGAAVVGLVDDLGEIDALLDEGAHYFHSMLARVAELEGSRVVDDSQVEAACGAHAYLAWVQLIEKYLTSGASVRLYDV